MNANFANKKPALNSNAISSKDKWNPEALEHPLFDRSERRLREIVSVCIGSHDGMPLRNLLFSRVPTLGEELSFDGRVFRVIGVLHASLDFDGRAEFGDHAILTVVEVPDEGWLYNPENPLVRKTRRNKSRRKPKAQHRNPQDQSNGTTVTRIDVTPISRSYKK